MRRLKILIKMLAVIGMLATAFIAGPAIADGAYLPVFMAKVPAASLIEGAERYGTIRTDVPVVPVLKGDETLGWAFITSDLVSTTGYSGKPIHVMVAIGADAKLIGAKLVKHSEPIVLVGIPNSKMIALTESFRGLDILAEVKARGGAHKIQIISGATVSVMIIDDSIVRASIKVARALGLGGLSATRPSTGPTQLLNPETLAPNDWQQLVGDGTVRSLTLDVGQVNAAFAATGDARAAARPIKAPPEDRFIDLYASLISVPAIGATLLGPAEYANQAKFLKSGDQSILIMGRGRYSFKGSGYVRGGIFERIQLIQEGISVRFHDKDHRRVGALAAAGAPQFSEVDIFRIPADSGFDPTKPWRLQLLVQRAVGAVEKAFITFDLGYKLPDKFLMPAAAPAASSAIAVQPSLQHQEEAAARANLWKRIWQSKQLAIVGLVAMLGVLTVAFFFQGQATRHARAFYWFRIGFLVLTLVFLGWWQDAQLSVVNLIALTSSLQSGFSWGAFLMDPLIFILWFSVAAALLFWGRGAYCGWLCPFGALQELTNQVARALRVPQWTLPWGLHERLWPVKYIIFLGLFGVSLVSVSLAETYAEVEPFKTAIILNFMRSWPFVLYAVVLLVIGLFVERFYCRYLCPLGAALAIPARLRMFAWLKRYRECGSPCQTCAIECPVQAIHPTGEINPNECVNCLHCQVLYQSDAKCPVVIQQIKRRARDQAALAAGKTVLDAEIAGKRRQKENEDV